MKAAVILATYNHPRWLEKVLCGYACQTVGDFEIVIADDGSGPETGEVIDGFRQQHRLPIKHVWHEDEGFRKCEILNKAILATEADYLIFSDGDCIPRKDFVQVHLEHAQKGYFLSGGYCKLPMELSRDIGPDDIESGRCFEWKWLQRRGLKGVSKFLKLSLGDWQARLADGLTTTKPTWNGHGASAFRSDILKINGFDEKMAYGGEDRELGERLWNSGLKSKQIRHRAVVLHLDHKRGYKNEETIQKNRAIRERTVREKRVWTENGIVKGVGPEKMP